MTFQWAPGVKGLNMWFEDYSEHQWKKDGYVKWSETCFPVYMDDILISFVMRTQKMMKMTIAMITKISRNCDCEFKKKTCKLSFICLLTCSKSTIETLEKV